MKELIKYRKRSAWRIFAIFLVFGISGLFAIGDFNNTFDSILGLGAKEVTNIEEFDNAVQNKDRFKVDVTYLDSTGFYYGDSSSQKYTISYTHIGDRIVLVRQHGGFTDNLTVDNDILTTITLKNTGKYYGSSLQRNIIESFATDTGLSYEEAENYFYPYIVDLVQFNSYTIFALIIPGIILAIGFAIFVFIMYRSVNDIEKYLSPDDMELLDNESDDPILTSKQFILTPTFFIRKRGINIKKQLIKTKDIAYVYRKVTTHRTYGIKTGQTQQIILYANGLKKPIEFATNEELFDNFVYELNELNLNIVFGYDANFVKVWRKSPSKTDFINVLKQDYHVTFPERTDDPDENIHTEESTEDENAKED